MFQFKVDYNRLGYTHLYSSTQVSAVGIHRPRGKGARAAGLTGPLSPLPGVRASPPAHAVRTFHPLGVPVLRRRLLHDGRPLHVQHRFPTHEGEGEIRLSSLGEEEAFSPGTGSAPDPRW